MNKRRGYTYLEIIIVIAIIGILAGFGITSYPGVQKQARDGKRLSDLKQYQTALENYAGSHGGFYPSMTSQTLATTLCAHFGMNQCAVDPKSGENVCVSGICDYYYRSNGSGGGTPDASQFVLYSRLEKKAGYWVYCSNGASGVASATTTFGSGSCPSF